MSEQGDNPKEKKSALTQMLKEAVGEITDTPINPDTQLKDIVSKFDSRMQIISPSHPYVPSASLLWGNLIRRIGLDILKSTNFKSQFGPFVQQLDTGADVMETFINLKKEINRNSLSNSDLFTMFPDDIKTSVHTVNREWVFVTDYRDAEIRKVVATWDTLTNFVQTIIKNLSNSFEFSYQNHVKQLFFDYWYNGCLDSEVVTDPRTSSIAAGEFVAKLNTLVTKFVTEPSKNNIIYNNLLVSDPKPVIGRCENVPLIVTFNEMIRPTEMQTALSLHFGQLFVSGNSNQDFMKNLIKLELDLFPNTKVETIPNFKGTPLAGKTPIAFVFDPAIFQFYTQFTILLDFINAVTMNTKQTLHTDLVLSLSPFEKGAVLAIN